MMPVDPQQMPIDFNEKVRNPGNRFLRRIPTPTKKQWKDKEYWRKILPDMRKAYNSICVYCAHWIPHSTGNHSIDHFVPKSQDPSLAYEWSNFRYVAARFNSRKGTKIILDPFTLLPNWFVIDFTSLFIKPSSKLLPDQKERVQNTIKHLKLNDDDDLITEREAWVHEYNEGHISFEHLEKRTPFIAYELNRQGLVE